MEKSKAFQISKRGIQYQKREFSIIKSALQQMLKDLYSQEIQEKEKDLQNQPQTIGNRNIYINNNCKCKWIKCTNHKIQTGGMDTKTRPMYMPSTRNQLQN